MRRADYDENLKAMLTNFLYKNITIQYDTF